MNAELASLIEELMCNAGYMDDADELLGDLMDHEGKDAAIKKAETLNELVSLINPFLPEAEHIKVDFVDEVNSIVND